MRARAKKVGGGLVLIDKVAVPDVPRVHKTYFGFKARMLPHVLRWFIGSRFIEPFCGGASLSWSLHRLGRETVSGDASYLGYLHAAGSVAAKRGPWVDLASVEPRDGFACALLRGEGPKQHGPLPLTPDAAAWLDGVCSSSRQDKRVLLAVGKVLSAELNAMRFPRWTNRLHGRRFLIERTEVWLRMINDSIVEGAKASAHHGKAHETILLMDCKGATMYLDPAWPFADGKTAAAFYDHPARVGEIVAQEVFNLGFMGNEDHLEYILALIRTFFERGGRRVLIATQSTNWPSADVLAGKLEQRVLHRETRKVDGGSHGTGFMEDMFVLEVA